MHVLKIILPIIIHKVSIPLNFGNEFAIVAEKRIKG